MNFMELYGVCAATSGVAWEKARGDIRQGRFVRLVLYQVQNLFAEIVERFNDCVAPGSVISRAFLSNWEIQALNLDSDHLVVISWPLIVIVFVLAYWCSVIAPV